MKNRTDLILGEAFCIFIFFYFLDSGLSVLNGLQFYFTHQISIRETNCIGLWIETYLVDSTIHILNNWLGKV